MNNLSSFQSNAYNFHEPFHRLEPVQAWQLQMNQTRHQPFATGSTIPTDFLFAYLYSDNYHI